MAALLVSQLHLDALAADRSKPADTARGDRMLAAYFEQETRRLAEACLADVKSWDDWTAQREKRRRQLLEMLGLDPLPERTPLRPVVTGKVEHPEFTVENLHFQSRPQLYITGNLYLPKNVEGPAPAILYVCGHSRSFKDGVSYGNKTKYQHHGAWFARNGYVCLTIDTLQLGEIEGTHHGTHHENMWWWNARGYTPAGVEAWNSIRALDYLESRPEVDASRLGVTGRSGGGAYSWYLAALDDRVQALVPVAGITNLKNHVVDGCVEGHCDCMYMVNTYRWDYPMVAALAAPRPLLISNSDQDYIFPLDGVLDVHDKVKSLYTFGGERQNLGLHIAVGPHKDTQVLQLHAFQWFNQHFKGDDSPIATLAEQFFEPQQLKVFDTLPADQINTRVHEVFTPAAEPPAVPPSEEAWAAQRDAWNKALREKSFAGWPDEAESSQGTSLRQAFEVESDGVRFTAYDFDSQHDVTLRLYLVLPAASDSTKCEHVALHVVDAAEWDSFLSAMRIPFSDQLKEESLPNANQEKYDELRKTVSSGRGLAFFAPRGIGRTAWNAQPRERIHIKRRFMLLGQTLDGMRVWDVRRAIQTLKSIVPSDETAISVVARDDMAGITLYAALFEPNIESLELHNLSASHREGPDLLNVLRILDVPQTLAMVAEKSRVLLQHNDRESWDYPLAVAEKFGWSPGNIEIQEASVGGK